MSIWHEILRGVRPGQYSDRALEERREREREEFALAEYGRLRAEGLSAEQAWHALIPPVQDALIASGWHPATVSRPEGDEDA